MLLVDVKILYIRIYCTRNLFSNVFVTWKCNVDSVRINSSLVEQKYSFYSQQLLESDCSNTKTERLVLNSFCFWLFSKAWFLDQFLLNLGKDWETHLFPFNYFISLFPIPLQIVGKTLCCWAKLLKAQACRKSPASTHEADGLFRMPSFFIFLKWKSFNTSQNTNINFNLNILLVSKKW